MLGAGVCRPWRACCINVIDLSLSFVNLIRQPGMRLKTMLASAPQRPWVVWTVVGTLGFVAALSVGSGLWFLSNLRDGLPDGGAIGRIGDMDQATIVLDQDDRPAFTIYKEHRIEIPLGEISPHLVQAIVAVEDQRFYQHQGFDIVRMASAA